MAISMHAVSQELHHLAGRLPAPVKGVVNQLITHPGFLPLFIESPLLAAGLMEAHKSGALGRALSKIGLGHVLGGGGGGAVRPVGPGSGVHGAISPGDFAINYRTGDTNYCNRGAKGTPFSLVGFANLAAGAQTQGTDLISYHKATANPTIISSDDLVPGNVEVYAMRLGVAARATVTLGFEGTGFLNSAWIIEYVNGIEKARWSMSSLNALLGYAGIVSSGSGYGNFTMQPGDRIPWHRIYDPNIKAKTALQIGVTTTTVSGLDSFMSEDGERP